MRLLLLFLALAVASPAAAQTFPALTGPVVDGAELLAPAQEEALAGKLEAFRAQSGRQFVVATVPNLQGYPIAEFGYRLGRHWRIGQSEANNGVILLIARDDRRIRLEVGYGLEPILTDAWSGRVIREQVTPRFRNDDYAGGIDAAADAIIAQLQAPPEQAEQRARDAAQTARGDEGGSMIPIVIWLAIFVVIILSLVRSTSSGRRYGGHSSGLSQVVLWSVLDELSRSRSWSGGGSSWSGNAWGGGGFGGGGGGYSGGGGSFGGGGASGSW